MSTRNYISEIISTLLTYFGSITGIILLLMWMIRKDNDKRNLDRPKFKYFIYGLCIIGIMYILSVALGLKGYTFNKNTIDVMLFGLYFILFVSIMYETISYSDSYQRFLIKVDKCIKKIKGDK